MSDRYLPSEAMAAAEAAWIARMEHLLSVIGTPRVRTLADLTTNTVVDVTIDWPDNPDIHQRAIRARAICELIEELKQESAS